MFDLKGKVALVTGAAKGIGRDVADTLEGHGATVVASDIDPSPDGSARGAMLRHDVTSEADWDAVLGDIKAREGRLDILVNNAGIILNKPFLDTSLDELRRVLRINVESVWIGMQKAAPLMTGGSGSIVNLSSIYGQLAGPMHAAYSASKGAVRLMTKGVAVEFARSGSGIRVNSVHPGPVETALGLSGLEPAVAAGRFPDMEAAKAFVASGFPMGRWANTGDVAGAVLFLASDASRFMTGTELVVDGGYSLL
ncbi:NAD(P)-dependent dehydrogenase, short-chain alcohol dehydrogenase family [Sphingopyxis sp. YR583]|uniref:SDR family NAD(P)-dependent oxidoreductase n=1 Tax=Sphingopyxis sp. YR583 TaxID=1881047 RepID=UPI0008A7C8D9|nr:SDR family oxidoreductase [Sphingopyxis sp. YR583]SEH19245.1 NAD(P)-dependent dehydrogenase, short-chain alcohol dehydrogenase family [Sphingopyxis sp. YR583]